MPKEISDTVLSAPTKVVVPGSKIMTLQTLIIAALADGVSEISGIALDAEINALLKTLQQLGIVVKLDLTTNSCIIAGTKGKFPKTQATLDCSELQSALYYLLTATAVSTGVYYFERRTTSVNNVALLSLIHLLMQQQAQFIPNDCNDLPFTLIATALQGGAISFAENISCEVISAFMLIAPFTKKAVTLVYSENQCKSLDLTCGLMADFGVLVQRSAATNFTISAPQHYQARDYLIEPELTELFYYVAATAISGQPVLLSNFNRQISKQAGLRQLALFEKLGCTLTETEDGLLIKRDGDLLALDVSIPAFSDCFLALAAVAPFTNKPMRITCHGEMSEADKKLLNTLKNLFEKFGLQTEVGDHWMQFSPGTPHAKNIPEAEEARINKIISLLRLKIT